MQMKPRVLGLTIMGALCGALPAESRVFKGVPDTAPAPEGSIRKSTLPCATFPRSTTTGFAERPGVRAASATALVAGSANALDASTPRSARIPHAKPRRGTPNPGSEAATGGGRNSRPLDGKGRRPQSSRTGPAPRNSAAPAISAVNPVPFLNTGATAAAGWPKEAQNQKKRTAATASSQRPQPHPFGFPFFRRLSFFSASSPGFGPAISPQRRGERRAIVPVLLRGTLRCLRCLR